MKNNKLINQKKIVLLRCDLNVPLFFTKDGVAQVFDDSKITAIIPTLTILLKRKYKVILLSHLGRPTDVDERFSLKPVALQLQKIISNFKLHFLNFAQSNDAKYIWSVINNSDNSSIICLENVRFFGRREIDNDPKLIDFWTQFTDTLVYDAFAVAHRSHASTSGILNKLTNIVVGPLMKREIQILNPIKKAKYKPLVVVIGGAKVNDKLKFIAHLSSLANYILVGGGIGNTFLSVVKKIDMGSSLYEKDKNIRQEIFDLYTKNSQKFVLPIDTVVLNSETKEIRIYDVASGDDLSISEESLDIGPNTIKLFKQYIDRAGSVFWNGPLGLFEKKQFANGSFAVAKTMVSASNKGAYTVIGGGESFAVLRQLFSSTDNKLNGITTAGGASLAYLLVKDLPVINILKAKNIIQLD